MSQAAKLIQLQVDIDKSLVIKDAGEFERELKEKIEKLLEVCLKISKRTEIKNIEIASLTKLSMQIPSKLSSVILKL